MQDEAPSDQSRLIGEWIHAHEQDSGGAQAYVRAGTPLPRSRGRSGFDFAVDGTVRRVRPGPTDRPELDAGTWRMINDRLQIQLDGGESLTYVVDAGPGQLMLSRQRAAAEEEQ